jgi:hypothetical protein
MPSMQPMTTDDEDLTEEQYWDWRRRECGDAES